MAKIIKNVDIVDHTYSGQLILAGNSYTVQQGEESSFINNDELLADISSGKIIINDGQNDISGIVNQIKYLSDHFYELDEQGRQIVRTAAGRAGWTYLARSIELETSKIGSLFSQDYTGNNLTDVSLKFYNSNNQEVTTPNDEMSIVKTVLTVKPNYDYELISGNLRQQTSPNSDVRIWTIGGILELGGPYVKEFTQCINMKFIGADEQVTTDGRASKYMKKDIVGVPYQGNQLQVIIRHTAGVYHKIMLILEYFRA